MMRCYIDWEDADIGYGVMSVFMTGQGYLLGTVNVVHDVKFAYKSLQCKMFGSLSQIIKDASTLRRMLFAVAYLPPKTPRQISGESSLNLQLREKQEEAPSPPSKLIFLWRT